jgi:multicomponent Na+:H+ antiporter subunit G
VRELIAYILTGLGILTITLGTIGLLRAPSIYTRLHAVSTAVALGVISFCMAGFLVSDTDMRTRLVLIALFLLLTTPVASHVIAQSAHRTGED